MESRFRKALEKCQNDIINDVDPTYLVEDLIKSDILNIAIKSDQELVNDIKEIQIKNVNIKYTVGELEKKRKLLVQKLLEILTARGNEAFHVFVKSIRETSEQNYLADALEEAAKVDEQRIPRNIPTNESLSLNELLGIHSQSTPLPPGCNRIAIVDLNMSSGEQKGTISFQLIHLMVKKCKDNRKLHSYLLADDTGVINLLAYENDGGKALDKLLKTKMFYQMSEWTLRRRNSRFSSLSNHPFELWIKKVSSLSELPLPGIPEAGEIKPLSHLNLKPLDKVHFLNEGATIDVMGIIHKKYPKEKLNGKIRMTIDLKDSTSKKVEKLTIIQCDLYADFVDLITKQNIIVIIKNTTVKKMGAGCRLIAGKESFLFFVDDARFDESWITQSQLELVEKLKPKKLQSRGSSNNLTPPAEVKNEILTTVVGPSNNSTNSVNLTPLSSSVAKSSRSNGNSSRKGTKRKGTSLLDVEKCLKKRRTLEPTLISNVRIVTVKFYSYDGCPNDDCTKKIDNPTKPYLCPGKPCKNSPVKTVTKPRYIITCTISNEDEPSLTKEVKCFDKTSRKLFEILEVDPSKTSDEDFLTAAKRSNYNINLKGSKIDCGDVWEFSVDNVDLSEA